MLTAVFSMALVVGSSFFGVCCGVLLAKDDPPAKGRDVLWAGFLSLLLGFCAVVVAGGV